MRSRALKTHHWRPENGLPSRSGTQWCCKIRATWRSRTSGGFQSATAVQIAEGPRPVAVSRVQVADHQSGATDQVIYRAVQMAAASDAAVHGMEPVLPAAYRFGRRSAVLEEMQRDLPGLSTR